MGAGGAAVVNDVLPDGQVGGREIRLGLALIRNGQAGGYKIPAALLQGLEQPVPAGGDYFEFDPQAIGQGLGQIILEAHGLAAVGVVAVGVVVGDHHQTAGAPDALQRAVACAAGHQQYQNSPPYQEPSREGGHGDGSAPVD